jgi:hypothetical protein
MTLYKSARVLAGCINTGSPNTQVVNPNRLNFQHEVRNCSWAARQRVLFKGELSSLTMRQSPDQEITDQAVGSGGVAHQER